MIENENANYSREKENSVKLMPLLKMYCISALLNRIQNILLEFRAISDDFFMWAKLVQHHLSMYK